MHVNEEARLICEDCFGEKPEKPKVIFKDFYLGDIVWELISISDLKEKAEILKESEDEESWNFLSNLKKA